MFNIQPGMGLAARWHRAVALGLGWYSGRREVPPHYYGGRHAYYADLELRQKILRDDEEIVEILAIIMPYL